MFCHQLKEESMLRYLSLCESPDFSFWLFEQKQKLGQLWWKVFHSQINVCSCFISTLLGIEDNNIPLQFKVRHFSITYPSRLSFCSGPMSKSKKSGDSAKMQRNHQTSQSKHSRQKKLLQTQVDSYYVVSSTQNWDEQFEPKAK